jgi:hypothetical protein
VLTVRDHAAIEHQVCLANSGLWGLHPPLFYPIKLIIFLFLMLLHIYHLFYHLYFIHYPLGTSRLTLDPPIHKNPRYARRTLGEADERKQGYDRMVGGSSGTSEGQAADAEPTEGGAGAWGDNRARWADGGRRFWGIME